MAGLLRLRHYRRTETCLTRVLHGRRVANRAGDVEDFRGGLPPPFNIRSMATACRLCARQTRLRRWRTRAERCNVEGLGNLLSGDRSAITGDSPLPSHRA